MTERNGNIRVLLWIAAVAVFLLGVFGTGYAMLDAKKADRDSVTQIREDVRELRNFFLGPKR